MTAIVKDSIVSDVIQALNKGDLSKLTEAERGAYIGAVCKSLGLNPLTRPFQFLTLQGKMVLYATKDATEQLGKQHRISYTIVSRVTTDGIHQVVARASTPDGRSTESVGAVTVEGLKRDDLANAFMKAECVPIEYEILTRDGFRSPLEIENGQEVASVCVGTGEIEWGPLESVSIFQGQTVTRYGNSYTEFEVTPGHSFVRETASGKRTLSELESFLGTDFLSLTGESCKSDGVSQLTPQEAATLGWLVTDGTIKRYRGDLYRGSICQSKKENFEAIQWAVDGCGGASICVTDNRERGWKDQHWWHLSKSVSQNLFAKAGFSSNEDLPGIAARLSSDARSAMLDAMMRADGDKRGNFGKTKRSVVECFQVLCALSGHLTSKTKERIQKNSTKPIFLCRKMSFKRVVRGNLEELGQRVTSVWCPTTSNGTWICRTDKGQVMVTGNTKAKRRATLSISGLSFLDESEIETVRGARKIDSVPQLPEITEEVPYATEIAACKSKDELQALYRERQADVAPEGKQAFLTAMADRKAELGK